MQRTPSEGSAVPTAENISSSVASVAESPATATHANIPFKPPVSSRLGLLAALMAFVFWGILPIFWKALASVNSFEVLCHRVFWSFATLVPLMFMGTRLQTLGALLRNPRNFLCLTCTGFLLAGNWFLYIWAINSNMVIEASLGYYINPLVNILFGVAIFKEKTTPLVWVAIAIAFAGVAYQVVVLGHFPFVPLGLAFSFALYALVRKLLVVEAIPGLFVETLVVMPLAAGYLFWQGSLGNSAFFRGEWDIIALLIGAGVITTIPLVLFAYGARRIRMTTLGILQYMTPTWVFWLGVFVYDEPFGRDNLITFGCIWLALVLYTWETIRNRQW